MSYLNSIGGSYYFEITNPISNADYVDERSGAITGAEKNPYDARRNIEIKWVVRLNGKISEATVTVYQKARTMTYGQPVVNLRYTLNRDVNDGYIYSNGTTVKEPILTYSQTVDYSDGTTVTLTEGGVVNVFVTRDTLTDGVVTLNPETGDILYVSPNTGDSERGIYVKASVTMNGKTGESALYKLQQSGRKLQSYGQHVVKLKYSNTLLPSSGNGFVAVVSGYPKWTAKKFYDNGLLEDVEITGFNKEYHGVDNDLYVNVDNGMVGMVPKNLKDYVIVCKRVKVYVSYTDENGISISANSEPASEIRQNGISQ